MSNSPNVLHPGTITFVDGSTQQITREAEASELPFEIAFVDVEGQYRPVVRIEAFTSPEQRVIHRYGPDGELLNTTIQLRNP